MIKVNLAAKTPQKLSSFTAVHKFEMAATFVVAITLIIMIVFPF